MGGDDDANHTSYCVLGLESMLRNLGRCHRAVPFGSRGGRGGVGRHGVSATSSKTSFMAVFELAAVGSASSISPSMHAVS